MSIMKNGLSLQADGLRGMLYAVDRESSRDRLKTKLRSDAKQSAISTAASATGLLLRGAVEAKKQGWFDDIGSVLEDVF